MIARLWRGWTKPENAEAYERLLHETIMPKIQAIEGYKGSQIMNRALETGEVEFVALTFWSSLEKIKNFVGEDTGRANMPPEAAKLLTRWDERVVHYEMIRNHKS